MPQRRKTQRKPTRRPAIASRVKNDERARPNAFSDFPTLTPLPAPIEELIDETFYDRVPVSPCRESTAFSPDNPMEKRTQLTPQKTVLFQTPVGMNNKQRWDTNMWQSGVLPAPLSFVIHRVWVKLFDRSRCLLPEEHPLWWHSYLSLFIGLRQYVGVPPGVLNQRYRRRWLSRSIPIGVQENFQVTFETGDVPVTTGEYEIAVFLSGTLTRQVC